MTLTKNRVFSGILATIYIIGAFVTVGGEGGFKALLFVIFPLACIWFGDAMGGFTGPSGRNWITDPSPGLMVCFLGWLLLLIPIFFILF